MTYWTMLVALAKRIPWWAWLCLAMGLYLGYLNMRLASEMRRVYVLGMRADSVEAANDTTRLKLLRIRDTVFRVFERRVVQANERADSLDRLLKRERRVAGQLVVQIERLSDTIVGLTKPAPDSGSRVAVFEEYRQPYRVKAEATLPVTGPPTLMLDVRLDSIPLGLRLGCDTGAPVRPATVAITAPAWANVRIAAISQSPEICNTPTVSRGTPGAKPYLIGGAVALGSFFLIRSIVR